MSPGAPGQPRSLRSPPLGGPREAGARSRAAPNGGQASRLGEGLLPSMVLPRKERRGDPGALLVAGLGPWVSILPTPGWPVLSAPRLPRGPRA